MKTRIGLALAISIAALIPSLACAGERATLSIGAGASGTSNSAFRGGWGATASLELPHGATSSFLVRADYHAIPEDVGETPAWAVRSDASLFGSWPTGAQQVAAAALLAGIRLHPPQGFQAYLDALVGVGYASDTYHDVMTALYAPVDPQQRDLFNVALSLGAGMKLPAGPGNLFLDAHYDFYFVETMHGAIIPVRFGYGFPIGKQSI